MLRGLDAAILDLFLTISPGAFRCPSLSFRSLVQCFALPFGVFDSKALVACPPPREGDYSGVISPPGSVSATFTNSIFTHNAAVGGDGTTPNTNGGAGQGGGLATVSGPQGGGTTTASAINPLLIPPPSSNGATSTVSGSTFTENLALGGAGRGSRAQQGAGLGGGLFSDAPSVLTLSTSDVNDNTANGNPGRGGGVASLGTFNDDGSNDISGNHASTSDPDVYNPVSL